MTFCEYTYYSRGKEKWQQFPNKQGPTMMMRTQQPNHSAKSEALGAVGCAAISDPNSDFSPATGLLYVLYHACASERGPRLMILVRMRPQHV